MYLNSLKKFVTNFPKHDSRKRVEQTEKNSNEHSTLQSIFEFWSPVIFIVALTTCVRSFVAEARYIPSGSMLPTLQIHDRLIVEKISFRDRSPRRGEVVVFNSPYSFDDVLISRRNKPLPSEFKCALVNLPLIHGLPWLRDKACHDYIKRVVAIEGDNVIVNSEGKLFVNSQLVDEPYVANYCTTTKNSISSCVPKQLNIPPDYVFVLGDNRENSWDGRYWPENGLLPKEEILGRAIWRFWPFKRVGNINLID